MVKRNIGRIVFMAVGVCGWFYLVYRYPAARLFTLFLPPVVALHWAKDRGWRNIFISIFVVLWLFIFHYESLRYFDLTSLTQREIPKLKFLFPPAGWIMFFNVNDSYSYVEVYGKKGNSVQLIDPHDIFRTRTVGFDNIHRNILSAASSQELAAPFCQFLKHRLPYYEDFVIIAVSYPAISKDPERRLQEPLYRCEP